MNIKPIFWNENETVSISEERKVFIAYFEKVNVFLNWWN